MKADASLRARLRVATEPAHERLHHHPGFAAAASGAISREDYRDLLERLLGFHEAFEAACERSERAGVIDRGEEDRSRAPMLVADLTSLGLDRGDIARLPIREGLAAPRSEAEWLGGLYVIEGSTLGGLHIARALKPLFADGEDDEQGRRFFLGYAERHGAMWRSFLERLERACASAEDADIAVEAALRTFDDFEAWMEDWRGAERGHGSREPEALTAAI